MEPYSDPRTVAIIQEVILRYRRPFYEALRSRLRQLNVTLRLIQGDQFGYLRGDEVVMPWAEISRNRYYKLGNRSLVWQSLDSSLRDVDLVIVEQASRLLLNYWLLLRQAVGGTKVAFWGHGRALKSSPDAIGEWLKARTAKRAVWWFAYTDLSAKLLRDINVSTRRITVVRNSTETMALKSAINALDPSEVAFSMAQLGLKPGRTGVFIGRLTEEKWLPFLLESSELIRDRVPDFSLLIVGAGPLEASLRARVTNSEWIHLVGAHYGSDLAPIFAMADLVLAPASVGLVAVDALAAGAPIVTNRLAPQNPEIAYLNHGKNAWFVEGPPRPDAYASAVVRLLLDDALRSSLASQSLADSENLGMDIMVELFAMGIVGALDYVEGAEPPRQ